MQASITKSISLGGLTVDLATRRVKADDMERRLSPKAAGVLSALIEAEGGVLSRADLLDRVWPDVTVGEEVLTQAVAELRRAFGDDARRPKFFETISKQGYRLLPSVEKPVSAKIAPAAARDIPLAANADAETNGLATPPQQHGTQASAILPSGPSIVILPFQSLTGDVESRVIATGVSRDAAVALARARWLFVTGRGSALVLTQEDLDPLAVAHRLGVRYAVSGSVVANSSRVSVSVQLCDAVSGQMIWGEVFERGSDALLDVIDSIGKEIGRTVESSLETHLRKVARLKPIEHLDAWGLYHRAEGPSRYASTLQEVEQAHEVLARAVELAPDAARISAALASLEFRRQMLFGPPTRHDSLMRCMEFARAALELDPDEPDALVPMGCALGAIGSRDLGLEHLRRSVAINPSSYPARVFLAWALLFMEQHEDALTNADAADRISPLDPANFHTTAIRAHALALAGESEQAYAAAEACDLHPRSSHLTSVVAAWCAVAAGRPDRAKFHNARLHAVRPDFRLEHYFALFPFQGEYRERIARHLRASGL